MLNLSTPFYPLLHACVGHLLLITLEESKLEIIQFSNSVEPHLYIHCLLCILQILSSLDKISSENISDFFFDTLWINIHKFKARFGDYPAMTPFESII